MDIKDILTPFFTVLAVYLAAHFALRNEHKKKALEIETAQIDSLSKLVDCSLDNFSQYIGALAGIIDIKITMMTTPYPSDQRLNMKIDIQQLQDWVEDINSHPSWGLNISDLRLASHGLRFHREADWLIWQKTVPQVRREINDFFMITQLGEENIILSDCIRTVEEAKAFTVMMRTRVKELGKLKETLLTSMKSDFNKLLGHEEKMTLCSLLSNLWRWAVHFFNFRP